jgi:hypothetical protein
VIPLPELGVEFVVGLGAALFGANLWVLVRPAVARMRGAAPAPRPVSTTRVVVNLVLGGIVAIWGIATLVARA